jgi:hypothetical protein
MPVCRGLRVADPVYRVRARRHLGGGAQAGGAGPGVRGERSGARAGGGAGEPTGSLRLGQTHQD